MEIGQSSCLGCVLAGGASSRMRGEGVKPQDKALLRLRPDGPTLLEQSVQLLELLRLPVAVSAPEGRYTLPQGVLAISDEPASAGQGPLAGLLACARRAGELGKRWLLTIPVDMPCLRPDDLRVLFGQAQEQPKHASIYRSEGDTYAYLCAIWRVDACIPVIEAQLAAGRRSVHALHNKLGSLALGPGPLASEGSLRNINNAQDWQALFERRGL